MSLTNTGATRDNEFGAFRNIWFETALRDIKLKVVHLRGKDNGYVDLLSHCHMTDSNTARLSAIISNPIWCMIDSNMLHINLNI